MMKQRTHSLQTILFRYFASIIVLVLLILTVSISANFSRATRTSSYDKYQNILKQSNLQLSSAFWSFATEAAALDYNPELISSVNLALHSSNAGIRLQNRYNIQKLLVSASSYSSYIKNIYIYKEDTVFFMNDSIIPSFSTHLKEMPWLTQLLNQETDRVIIPYGQKYFIYARPFQRTLHEPSPGAIIFFFDSKFLQSCLENVEDDAETLLCVFDEDNTLLYVHNEEYRRFLSNQMEKLSSSPSGQEILLDGTSYFCTKEINEFSGWTLVSLVPTSIILKGLMPFYLQILPLVLLILGLSIYLAFILSRRISQPIEPLLKSMEQSSSGDFTFQPYQTKIQEINTLITGYDEMLHRISTLIHHIQKIEKDRRRTEMEVLQAQISPHFIYNTLNSIRWLALMQNSPKIAEIIFSFSSLLELASSHPSELITVEEELQISSHYLDIMNFRYNGMIQITWDVEPTVRQYKTLKLVIQPIVENCFCHGFSSAADRGVITISCRREENILIFNILDNGAGFSWDSRELPPSSATEGHHNIGLANVRNRIQLWFGENYGLTITSAPGKGTNVLLTQPILAEETEELYDTDYDRRG